MIAGIHRAVEPDTVEIGVRSGTDRSGRQRYAAPTEAPSGRIFSALAHARVNVKMIDQGSSELEYHYRCKER